ncbi:ABC transporter permease [Aurantivibrio infirmus]
MLENYLLVMLRGFKREKVYVLINIIGLSLALACSIILGQYIHSELSYDQHNINHERIARVAVEVNTNGQYLSTAESSPALGPLIERSYPQVGDYVRFNHIGRDTVLRTDTLKYSWEDIYFADNNVFDIFTHRATYGNLQNALSDPSSIVVSESLARTYWGDANPVGKSIRLEDSQYRVSAVFEDLPENSHLKYDALLSYDVRMASFGRSNEDFNSRNLLVQMDFTYFKVPEGFRLNELERTLNQYYAENGRELGEKIGMDITYRVQALADIHFDTGWNYDRPTGNIFYLYGFSAVALFILLVACINYTNLATARATKRSKEVGMRKVIGAEKKHLIVQFLGESLVYTSIAFFLSLALVEVLETFSNLPSLIGMQELLNLQQDPSLVIWLGLLALGIGIVAGLYPAFYLSSISPKAALTATQHRNSSKFSLREFLVCIQFFVSISVVACTLLMALQMTYVSSKALGFEKEERIFIQLRGSDAMAKLPVIRSELLDNPNILGVAESSFIPGGDTMATVVSVESSDGAMESGRLWIMNVSKEFFDVMGMSIVEGRDFSQSLSSDAENSLIVNEALVRQMNWENPLEKNITIRVSEGERRVMGVVNDFHFASLRRSVQPLAIQLIPPRELASDSTTQENTIAQPLIIQLSGDDVAETIRHIESVIAQFDPNHLFEFTFFEDALNELYTSEESLMALTGIFSIICIFISSIGLYGLSAFNTEQRTKEIGVRKVLGASVSSIVLMLAKGQLILIGLSAVIASIVSYLAIDNWLTAFAYRSEIAYWVFFVSALSVTTIALATITLQSAKTAQANPVEALRFE